MTFSNIIVHLWALNSVRLAHLEFTQMIRNLPNSPFSLTLSCFYLSKIGRNKSSLQRFIFVKLEEKNQLSPLKQLQAHSTADSSLTPFAIKLITRSRLWRKSTSYHLSTLDTNKTYKYILILLLQIPLLGFSWISESED